MSSTFKQYLITSCYNVFIFRLIQTFQRLLCLHICSPHFAASSSRFPSGRASSMTNSSLRDSFMVPSSLTSFPSSPTRQVITSSQSYSIWMTPSPAPISPCISWSLVERKSISSNNSQFLRIAKASSFRGPRLGPPTSIPW